MRTSVLRTELLGELFANKVFQPLDFRRETLLDRLAIVPRFRTPRDDILLARLYTHQLLIHGELVLLLVLPTKPVRPKRFVVRCVR